MQKVAIVNGTAELLDLINGVLGAGHYDAVFIESSAHAYSQVRREHPSLVILCLRLDDPSGFQVLSMLKMDEDTRTIPVLTYTSEYDGQPAHQWTLEASEGDLLQSIPAAAMN
jgi:DNA-binding response OmpR family regulator